MEWKGTGERHWKGDRAENRSRGARSTVGGGGLVRSEEEWGKRRVGGSQERGRGDTGSTE